MVLEKTPEVKKIKDATGTVVTSVIIVASLVSVGGSPYYRTPVMYAALLVMLSLYAHQFRTIVAKMDLLKHGPDALQKKLIDTLPVALLSIGCALLLVG